MIEIGEGLRLSHTAVEAVPAQPPRSWVFVVKHECPNCGAPAAYPGGSAPATCAYCGTISSLFRPGGDAARTRDERERAAAADLRRRLVRRGWERRRHELLRQRDAATAAYQDCRDKQAPRGPGSLSLLMLVAGAGILWLATAAHGAVVPLLLGAVLLAPFVLRLARLPHARQAHRRELQRRRDGLQAVKAELAAVDARLVALYEEAAALTAAA
jgi:hypothetical protein